MEGPQPGVHSLRAVTLQSSPKSVCSCAEGLLQHYIWKKGGEGGGR